MKTVLGILLGVFFCAWSAQALEIIFPRKGNWEFGVTGGSGHAFTNKFRGITNSANLVFAGARFGWIVAAGKEWNLEYGMEAIPAFVVHQEVSTYGIEGAPFLLRWNFAQQHKVYPDLEFGAGVLFSNDEVPTGTSRFNFTPQASLGISFWTRQRQTLRLGVKYLHISNAGLGKHNPGFNTIDFVASYHWFR